MSPNLPRRMLKSPSPRVTDRRSLPSPASEKKRSSKVSELESQLSLLQEELKKTKDQLNSSESSKSWAHQEAEEAKRQLAATLDKLEDSQKQLTELSASEDSRISELRKISQDRDRAWQSELEALQRQHKMDSSALAFANNEIAKLRNELKESLALIHELKSQLKDCEGMEDPFGSEGLERNGKSDEDFEKLKKKLNYTRTEVERLKSSLDLAEKRYQEEYIKSTFQIRSAYELFERLKTESSVREAELESKLKKARAETEALKKATQNHTNDFGKSEFEMDLRDLKVILLDKEMELQSVAEENKMLKLEIERREVEWNKANEEAVSLAGSEREAELRKLKIQSDQWRKAAEAAAAMLSNENDDKFSDHNHRSTIGAKLGMPVSEDLDEELAKKKNATVLKKIGVLFKGQK